jgi:hypothetical protein
MLSDRFIPLRNNSLINSQEASHNKSWNDDDSTKESEYARMIKTTNEKYLKFSKSFSKSSHKNISVLNSSHAFN